MAYVCIKDDVYRDRATGETVFTRPGQKPEDVVAEAAKDRTAPSGPSRAQKFDALLGRAGLTAAEFIAELNARQASR